MVMSMDRAEEVLDIYKQSIPKEEKIRLLEELCLDLNNEMEAQDQNMQPELHNKLSEGLRLATDFLRELREGTY